MNFNLLDLDQKYVWHPYASVLNPPRVFAVKQAQKCILTLENNQKLIDGMASWWCVIHGYNQPQINQALQAQIEKFSHVMLGGLTHEPVVKLAQVLADLTQFDKVFFADSGSVSVEVALKMALQYWYNQNKKEKHKFLTIYNGYHGDTFGAMSVCDPINGMHTLFSSVLMQNIFIPAPKCKYNQSITQEEITILTKAFQDHHQDLAAVIVEPIVQGAGGMRIYCSEYLNYLRKLCDEYNILLIFDEIATGFGRTGKLFAMEHANIRPDILCLGKALTGGYMSLAATLTTDAIAEQISNGSAGVLMHGPTFMGNPLACTAAITSIDLLLASSWQTHIANIENIFQAILPKANYYACVKETRVLGAIGVIELEKNLTFDDIIKLQNYFMGEGIWLRPFRNLIYAMPPYIITKEECTKLAEVMVGCAALLS